MRTQEFKEPKSPTQSPRCEIASLRILCWVTDWVPASPSLPWWLNIRLLKSKCIRWISVKNEVRNGRAFSPLLAPRISHIWYFSQEGLKCQYFYSCFFFFSWGNRSLGSKLTTRGDIASKARARIQQNHCLQTPCPFHAAMHFVSFPDHLPPIP